MNLINRRTFLVRSGAWAALLATASQPVSGFAASLANSESGDTFLALSQFLTHRETLNPDLAVRMYEQLNALDAAFPQQVQRLAEAIAASQTTHIDDYLALKPAEPLHSTMKTIISAWYLGYTGTPDLSKQSDNSRFVTFRDALMFEPTIDATIIPTYSRGPNGYWTQPPATLATD